MNNKISRFLLVCFSGILLPIPKQKIKHFIVSNLLREKKKLSNNKKLQNAPKIIIRIKLSFMIKLGQTKDK
jgi:hypothetical protein